jgi:hypothetical protein
MIVPDKDARQAQSIAAFPRRHRIRCPIVAGPSTRTGPLASARCARNRDGTGTLCRHEADSPWPFPPVRCELSRQRAIRGGVEERREPDPSREPRSHAPREGVRREKKGVAPRARGDSASVKADEGHQLTADSGGRTRTGGPGVTAWVAPGCCDGGRSLGQLAPPARGSTWQVVEPRVRQGTADSGSG